MSQFVASRDYSRRFIEHRALAPACPPHESPGTLGVHPMDSRPLHADQFQAIVDEAREFLRPFAGDMPDDSFDALVLHVAHVRRRDRDERHARKRPPRTPVPDAE